MFKKSHPKPPTTIAAILSEGDVAHGQRSRETANDLLPDLKTQLGLRPGADAYRDPLLEDFLIEAVLGAAWYQKRLRGAQRKVWGYIGLNAALVIALPLALIGLGAIASILGHGALGTSATLVSQLTGVLTGVLALQKTLSVWYASQQRYAVWFKASADLKSVYYALVQNWAGRIEQSPHEFLGDLQTSCAAARQIISNEQLDFYQKLALPSFDILDMLTASRSTASSFVASLIPGDKPSEITMVGRTAMVSSQPSTPPPGTTSTAVGQAGGHVAASGVVVRAAGAAKPSDNPYTVVIIANPSLRQGADANIAYVADPILQTPDVFEGCVRYVTDSLFGRLPGQKEKFLAPFESQIRIVTIFDATQPATSANALAGESDFLALVEPVQANGAAVLSRYQVNGRPLKADVVFAVTASPHYKRSSALFTLDDDNGPGVAFDLDGTAYAHRFNNQQPGIVALHVNSTSVIALHEFSHAASSWTNGSVKDLYVDNDMDTNPVNIRVGAPPVPKAFAKYNGQAYLSDPTRDGLGYHDWSSYHCELIDPAFPALMDNFWEASSNRPEDCMHDKITVAFLTDRIKAIMARP